MYMRDIIFYILLILVFLLQNLFIIKIKFNQIIDSNYNMENIKCE